MMPIVLNTIKLSLGSLFFAIFFSCVNKPKSIENIAINQNRLDTCIYDKHIGRQIMSGLGCDNCHTKLGSNRYKDIPTFDDISILDSLKILEFSFIKRHNGWYNKNGDLKSARMDTLSDCEIKSVIRYIKDYNRDTPPMPSQ
ncbi:hypothetical protein [Pedobacter sp. R20-19]|uniref:hypothetical protein n=1 Tax=Pedobacter sp. R20-19 TaxID=1270196 RepID=UPI0004936A81|nr:hypothetical protein [Pedobacter sp. R20-19]